MTKSIRQTYGETLAVLGERNEKIVVLDADVSSSTQTGFFAKAFPERFFNMGIAESNMVSTAAGLAKMGYVPFVNTFAVFLTSIGLISTRTLICYPQANVKLAGAYCGMSDAFDGATHHALEDIAIMRAQANMRILCPSDETSARALTALAAEVKGPCYLRLSRDSYPQVYGEADSFQLGGSKVLRPGTDIAILACGSMVHQAMIAAETLEKEGVSARVVDMYSLKPVDCEQILACAREARLIVTAEEHNIIGGLGSAVAEVMADAGASTPLHRIGVRDCFTESGPYTALMEKYGLDAPSLVASIRQRLSE